MTDSYAAAGVDTAEAGRGIGALVSILRTIDTGSPSRSVLSSGHFANVLRVAPNLGIALSTDGVGSKLVLAEQTGRLSTVGIDCIAMNVNDVVCVGARPIAVLDYLAVERVDAAALEQIAIGLKRGAEDAGVEIPGGELAVIPELIRGHPSPNGFDLCGACVGTVALDAIVTGADCRPGDVLIGLPSSGLHSNGYTLARRVIAAAGLELDARPEVLGGVSLADALLEPTVIYVRAVLELLESEVAVRGLAHITGDGVLNLLRLHQGAVGFTIDEPLAVPAICRLVVEHGALDDAEAYEVFNMGCGFVVVVAPEHAEQAVAMLGARHPGAARIGEVSDRAGTITLPGLGLEGDATGLRADRTP
jgi:phosphoribosylformylglycinamidine cyclo-ligase